MNWIGNLQQLGRALMLPTLALPVAAIFIRLGDLPWGNIGATSFGEMLLLAGYIIFSYLPIIFAVGVALGLTESAGLAGMSAMLGYFIFTRMTQHALGETFQLGVSGGILMGLVAAGIYNRLKNVKLPESIQFFGGPRIVPLVMGPAAMIVAYIMIGIGPYMEVAMDRLNTGILTLGGFGAFLYGLIYRLLVPFGLHHILNNFFWFQLGAYSSPNGEVAYGDLPRFFAGDQTAGIYMAGLYPITMFALPAIAFAIIHEARRDVRPKIKITFMTAALACFLTGVTEPIEFSFLFVAPFLFVIHTFFSGIAMWLATYLNIHHGFSYSAGALDFIINLHLSQNGLLLIPIGIGYGIIYYVIFRWAIRRFNLRTPGLEDGSKVGEMAVDIPHRAPLILQALGGKENIKQIEACITRLRLTVANDKTVSISSLKHLGAAGVIRLGSGNVQVVFGTFSELIREEILKVIRKDIRPIVFSSPVQGRMISLTEVPDHIFAEKIVGEGVAFIPDKGELVAPVAGEIIHIYPTKHALGIRTEEGLEVLLHIGIDTSSLEEQCFTAFVKEGDLVTNGQLLIKFNLNRIKKLGKSIVTPMIITNSVKVKSWSFAPYKAVKKGQASVLSVMLKNEQ